MRTITTTTNVFTFDELSEDAKEKAIENCRETEFLQSGEYFETLNKALDVFGLKLTNWSIDWDCLGRSSWKTNIGRLDDTICEDMTGNRLRTWLLNNHGDIFRERKHYGKYFFPENSKKGRYPRYSKIHWQETCCPFTGFMGDECFLDVFRNFIKSPDKNTNLTDLIESAVHAVFQAGANEWEAIQSDAYTIEQIKEQGLEFTEYGKNILTV